MKIKILFLSFISLLIFSGCNFKINDLKPKVISEIKKIVTLKNSTAIAILPNGNQTINIGNETVEVKSETIENIRKIIELDAEINERFIDLIGDPITDENIAKLAYYSEKWNIKPEKLMEIFKK